MYVQAYSLRSKKADPPIHAVPDDSHILDGTALCGARGLTMIIVGGEGIPFTIKNVYVCGNCAKLFRKVESEDTP